MSFWRAKAEESEKNYWSELEEAAEHCFNEHQINHDLISWKEKQEKKLNIIKLIGIGSDVILEIENATLQIEVLEEQVEILNQGLRQEGVQGIQVLYEIKKEIATQKAKLNVSKHKFDAILKACGKK